MTDIIPRKELVEFVEEHADCINFRFVIVDKEIGYGMQETTTQDLKVKCDHGGLRMELDN